MANLNRVLLIGNLTADPELRRTPKGTAVTDIRMAINRYFTSESGDRQEETTFVDVTLWGRQAETAKQYLTKGKGVFIEGRLQLDTWEEKTTGAKRSRLRVVAENMQMLGSSAREGGSNYQAGGSGSAGGNSGYQSRSNNNSYADNSRDSYADNSGADYGEDIPF